MYGVSRFPYNNTIIITNRPLGPLTYARVWHDNSGRGKYSSWFLNYIIVTDLQTRERFNFIANQWFAVDEDNGLVSKTSEISDKFTFYNPESMDLIIK